MAGVGCNNRAGREEKQINMGAEGRDRLAEEHLPASPPAPVVGTEDRDKSYAGPS